MCLSKALDQIIKKQLDPVWDQLVCATQVLYRLRHCMYKDSERERGGGWREGGIVVGGGYKSYVLYNKQVTRKWKTEQWASMEM